MMTRSSKIDGALTPRKLREGAVVIWKARTYFGPIRYARRVNGRAGGGRRAEAAGAMGKRSDAVTAMQIIAAFLRQASWSQRRLASEVGITPKSLRRHLTALRTKHGWPLKDTRTPGDRTWEVPVGWGPGGVLVPDALVPDLVRLLARVPRTKAHERIAQRVCLGAPTLDAVVRWDADPEEEEKLPLLFEAATKRVPLEMRYRGAGRGKEEDRVASVQRILPGARTRFLAMCHKALDLRMFRVNRIVSARLAPEKGFLTTDPARIDRKIAESLGGMHEGGPAQDLWFFVRDPDARWVEDSLLPGMKAERTVGGIRVSIRTSAPTIVARFVAGLGKAAVPEAEALERIVSEIAGGALAGCEEASRQRRASEQGVRKVRRSNVFSVPGVEAAARSARR